MIESCYWRAELRNDLVWLRKQRTYHRWSEKQQVLFERKLMIVAFQVRSLLERPKVNDQARGTCMPVLRYKKKSEIDHSPPQVRAGLKIDSTWSSQSLTHSAHWMCATS